MIIIIPYNSGISRIWVNGETHDKFIDIVSVTIKIPYIIATSQESGLMERHTIDMEIKYHLNLRGDSINGNRYNKK